MTGAEPRLERLSGADVEAFSRGATILGSGGGGRTTYMTTALGLIGSQLHLDVLALGSPLPDALAIVGIIGSTMVMEEKVPSGDELPRALAVLERWSGERVGGILPAQVGGVSSLTALHVAHRTRLPVVDADFEGRAIPRLDQLSIFSSGVVAVDAAAVTSGGLTIFVAEASADDLEAAWRETVAHSGGWAAFAIGPLAAESVRARAIPGTLSRAVQLGRLLERAGTLRDFARDAGGRVVTTGRIIAIDRYGEALSFVHSSLVVIDSANGAVVRIEAGSEYLLVLVDGEPIASTPSIIVLLDPRTREPVATDDAREGMTVSVVVLPGAPWWREHPERLRSVSPRAYGVDFDVLDEVAP